MTRSPPFLRSLLPLVFAALGSVAAVSADSADSNGSAEPAESDQAPDATVHRSLVAAAEERSRETAAELVPTVLSIFERSCADCHDSARARPKGGFGNIMDLAAIRKDPALLVPGEPMESELYLLITDPDPEFMMPPPDSDHPELTRVESRLVEQWILGGAPASVDFYDEDDGDTAEPEAGGAADEAVIKPPAD
ncbi:MAG: c-type cytochrome domain-containing protein, partial [Verrucomicrobiota bacterium]